MYSMILTLKNNLLRQYMPMPGASTKKSGYLEGLRIYCLQLLLRMILF